MSNYLGSYILTNIRTGEFYIGSAKNVFARKERHLRDIKAGRHHCTRVQQSWKHDDEYHLRFYIAADRESAFESEQWFIKQHLNSPLFMNTSLGAKGGDTLTRSPNREKRIARMSEIMQAKMNSLTPEEKKIRFGLSGDKNGMYGKTHTEEVKQRLSLLHKGVTRRSGFKLTDEHRRQISEHAKTRVGILNPFYGKSHSGETKKKIAEAKKAQAILPPNTRKIKIDEVVYESVTDAARKLSISPALVVYRLKSDKYEGYSYLT